MINPIVTTFIEELEHPLKKEIEYLRTLILSANKGITENIKWNAPNFCFNNEDRITMRIHPPKNLQLVFHRGAKVKTLPTKNLITEQSVLLIWKTTDRAVATFNNMADIKNNKNTIIDVVNKWIIACVE